MNEKFSIDWYLLIVFLGIFQALLLSLLLLIKSRKSGRRFRYLALLIFSLALILTDVFLNYSGYIIQIIQIDKFSFPIQFLVAPSLFVFINKSLYPNRKNGSWIHYLVFIFFLLYFSFYYFQDSAFKFNVHVDEHGMNLAKMATDSNVFYDPLKIHPYFHVLVFIHLLVYAILLGIIIARKYIQFSLKFFNMEDSFINRYRNLFIFYVFALLIMAYLVFRYFWLGDFLFSLYLTGIIYIISINITIRSLNHYFRNKLEVKYASSSLGTDDKVSILNKIREVVEDEEFYCRDSASLEDISNRIKVSKHYVSQVINELLHKSFFEYLAELRVGKSKSLLSDSKYHNLTIDEISFMVGYNSRSAYNRVFKSTTGTTPAEYRRTNKQ